MRFVVVNESHGAKLAPAITPEWLAEVASALEVQCNRDVAFYWGGSHTVRVAARMSDVQPYEVAVGILDALPNAPGDVAYHDVSGNAVPIVWLALDTCATLDDVSTALSHELAETIGDPACNAWRDGPDGQEHCQELCDPVQELSYPVLGVLVADFVLPAYFAAGSPGPYHFMAATGEAPDLPGPFATASGGYQIVRTPGGRTSQVHGDIHPGALPRKRHWTSRTYRRGARI